MTSYRDAGVDIAGAHAHVDRIMGSVTSTWGPQVVGAFGGFAAGIRIPEGYEKPILMMTTDGVGTKLELARRIGIWDGVGRDLVAMCVDDLAVVGASAIGLVDYMAVGALDPDRDATIVASIAAACIEAACPLIGGETAEHPGVMETDAVDLAAAAIGIVEEGQELGPDRVEPADHIVGLASPNLRSNGFSLVRKLIGDDVDQMRALLEPSVIYAPQVLKAIAVGGVHAAAHVTGGGIVANLRRSIPNGLGALVDTSAWRPPPVFDSISDFGVERTEMFTTFNMGIGFCLIVSPAETDRVMSQLGSHDPKVIGEIDGSGLVALV